METRDDGRRNSLDEMSRDDLVKKCKALLAIAHKAKQSKDVLLEENEELKKKLQRIPSLTEDDATNEIIENLTQQKLLHVTTIEDLKNQNSLLSSKLQTCLEELCLCEEKSETLDNENISYKRQVKRLTDENEELVSHLDGLERQIEEFKRIGLEQQNQLVVLEKTSGKPEENCRELNDNHVQESITELQSKLDSSLRVIEQLQAVNLSFSEKVDNLKINLEEKNKNILTISTELTHKNELLQSARDEISQQEIKFSNLQSQNEQLNVDYLKLKETNDEAHSQTLSLDNLERLVEKLKEKIKFYHSKLVKFALNVKSLKEEKNQLLDLFKMYTKQVEEWKGQLSTTSQLIFNHLNLLETENEKLKIDNATLKENNVKFMEQLEAHKTDDEKSKAWTEIETMKSENLKLQEEIKSLLSAQEEYNNQIAVLTAEKESIETAKTDNKKLSDELNLLITAQEKYKRQLEELTLDKESLETLKGENEQLSQEIKSLLVIQEEQKKQLELLSTEKSENVKLQEEINSLVLAQDDYRRQIEILTVEKESIETTKTKNKKLSDEVNSLITAQENYKKQLDELTLDKESLETLKSENQQLSQEIKSLLVIQEEHKKQLELVYTEKQSLDEELRCNAQKHEEEIKIFDDQSKRDTLEIRSKTEENEKICIEYRKIITKLEDDLTLNSRQIEQLQRQNNELTDELRHVQSNEKQLADKTSQEILKLVQENQTLVEENKKLIESQYSQSDESASKDKTHKRENAELLVEMNEMNQALKERGETISKLQAHGEEIMKKLQLYETQANKNVDNISQKDKTILDLKEELETVKKQHETVDNDNAVLQQKDAEINQMREQIEGLKERLDSSYAESETMSTSTISRTEEMSRLKDLEGSWEERYGKLRNLAIKLKSKIRDLTSDLTREQSEKNDLQQKNAACLKTITAMQDKLEDSIENNKKDSKDLLLKLDTTSKESIKFKQMLEENEQLVTGLKRQLEELLKEKEATDNWKKQISAKVHTMRKELESDKLIKKELELQIEKLTADLESGEQALKQTRASLDQSNTECKKQSVLSLEMQDYERSVKELSMKLDKKQNEVEKFKSQIETQKTTIDALREQNKLLEERSQEVELTVSTSNFEVEKYKKQVTELEDVIVQKEAKIKNVTQLLDHVRCEKEELSTELSKIITEHQKVSGALRSDKELLKNQTMGLQQTLRETQDLLKLKTDDLCHVKGEFENYKVRAQSVLRQNQSRDVGAEEKLSEELSFLKSRCDELSSQINEQDQQIVRIQKERDTLRLEKENTLSELRATTEEVKNLKDCYDQLTGKHQQMLAEHAETVRSLKVHAETLAQCYRQQLSEQEVRHNREIIDLQGKLERPPSPTDLTMEIPPTAQREEGEGSESNDSYINNNHYSRFNNFHHVQPVPLERLLGPDSDQDVSYLKKQLSEEESKVIHLTALLADTEQDLAKHAQMNKLLKEEIRRQQRSIEREEHAENLEYLKNIVFKFITLHSGDERTRLIPVLNTILKLSPEESQKLNLVARGDPSLRGWTNYLSSWSSGSKPS